MTKHSPLTPPKPAPSPTTKVSDALTQARTLIAGGGFQDALTLLRPLLAIVPADPQAFDLSGDCYWDMGRTDQAMEIMDTMVSLWPDMPALLGKRAARHLSLGQKGSAQADFQAMLDLQPGNLQVIAALNLIKTFAPDSPEAATLKAQLAAGKLSKPEQVVAQNCLGRIYFKTAPDQAMAHFCAAKAATPGQYDPAAIERRLTSHSRHMPTTAVARPQPDPQMPAQAGGPVFITGLPRSGTTLLETMLLRHEDITSLGENPSLIQARMALEGPLQKALFQDPETATQDPWRWCSQLPPDGFAQVLHKIAALYDQLSTPRLQRRARWHLDKLPQNVFEMQLAALAMPEARFVFMRRHPLDVGLSLISNNFHAGHSYSKQLGWIGHYIRANYTALEDCAAALGPRLRQQSYRALVQNPEAQIRQVLEHIGAGWNPDCLHPEGVDSAVRTASVTQVRAGINLKGLEKWRPFEAELAPLIDALGGWDWIRQWEAEDSALANAG